MADHFAAFSFVDRITEHEPGRRARGRYAVPAGVAGVPVLPRRRSGRAARRVGRDGAHRLSRPAGRGARQRNAIPCRRRARRHARPRRRHRKLRRGRGRLRGSGAGRRRRRHRARRLPRPDAAGRGVRFARRHGGALRAHPRRRRDRPAAFHGVAAPRVVRTAGVPGVSASATLHVPESAPFFGDHFPRRPVFPATLLLDAQIGLALDVAAEATHWPAGTRPAPSRMTHVKMRSFIPPGATLDIDAELAPPRRARRDGPARGADGRQDGRHRAARSARAESAT